MYLIDYITIICISPSASESEEMAVEELICKVSGVFENI
jgi:hypothetical protein